MFLNEKKKKKNKWLLPNMLIVLISVRLQHKIDGLNKKKKKINEQKISYLKTCEDFKFSA